MFVTVANRDKRAMIFPVKRLADLGFEILATEGTAEVLRRNGVPRDGRRASTPSATAAGATRSSTGSMAGEVDLIVNTPFGSRAARALDGYEIRTAAVTRGHPVHDHGPGRSPPRCRASRRWSAARSG